MTNKRKLSEAEWDEQIAPLVRSRYLKVVNGLGKTFTLAKVKERLAKRRREK